MRSPASRSTSRSDWKQPSSEQAEISSWEAIAKGSQAFAKRAPFSLGRGVNHGRQALSSSRRPTTDRSDQHQPFQRLDRGTVWSGAESLTLSLKAGAIGTNR